MVISGKDRERETEKSMAMGPERSKPLHNFTMPCLKWGNQRFLRCMKVNSNDQVSVTDRRSSAPEVERGLIGRRREPELERRGSTDRKESFKVSPPPPAVVGGSGRKSKSESEGDGGIDAVREKLMFDLQTEADKMKGAIFREGLVKEPPAAETEAVRPWNLRIRRAACKAPNGISGGGNAGGGKSFQVNVLKSNSSPLRTDSKSPRLRGSVVTDTASQSGEKRERETFRISLSRQEIEKDFIMMAGQRLPRRPKKRAKTVQKGLDTLFPGLWLTEVTADLYKVPDDPETGKR